MADVARARAVFVVRRPSALPSAFCVLFFCVLFWSFVQSNHWVRVYQGDDRLLLCRCRAHNGKGEKKGDALAQKTERETKEGKPYRAPPVVNGPDRCSFFFRTRKFSRRPPWRASPLSPSGNAVHERRLLPAHSFASFTLTERCLYRRSRRHIFIIIIILVSLSSLLYGAAIATKKGRHRDLARPLVAVHRAPNRDRLSGRVAPRKGREKGDVAFGEIRLRRPQREAVPTAAGHASRKEKKRNVPPKGPCNAQLRLFFLA